MKRYFCLYRMLVAQHFKILMEYRIDFIVGAFAAIFRQIFSILFIWVIFSITPSINGWSFYEVTFLYGLMSLSIGLSQIFFDNFWSFSVHYISNGQFDILLLRPMNSLFQIIAEKIEQEGIGELIIGIFIFTTSIHHLSMDFGLKEFLFAVLFSVSGALIISSVVCITCVMNFWFIRGTVFMWAVHSCLEMVKFPVSIFNRIIKIILTLVIPYAFVSFYPANHFIDKGYTQFSLLSPLVAVLFCILAGFAWNIGVRHYSSTGS